MNVYRWLALRRSCAGFALARRLFYSLPLAMHSTYQCILSLLLGLHPWLPLSQCLRLPICAAALASSASPLLECLLTLEAQSVASWYRPLANSCRLCLLSASSFIHPPIPYQTISLMSCSWMQGFAWFSELAATVYHQEACCHHSLASLAAVIFTLQRLHHLLELKGDCLAHAGSTRRPHGDTVQARVAAAAHVSCVPSCTGILCRLAPLQAP